MWIRRDSNHDTSEGITQDNPNVVKLISSFAQELLRPTVNLDYFKFWIRNSLDYNERSMALSKKEADKIYYDHEKTKNGKLPPYIDDIRIQAYNFSYLLGCNNFVFTGKREGYSFSSDTRKIALAMGAQELGGSINPRTGNDIRILQLVRKPTGGNK